MPILRRLELRDAPYMLEWMHDPNVVGYLQGDFIAKTMEDCYAFIRFSWDDKENMHLAIENNMGEYMGTVSLKNIDRNVHSAEFAIAIRRCAMGTGLSKKAMQETMYIGFKTLGLTNIYWCVSPKNKRAVCFYSKNGYKEVPAELLKIKRGVYSSKQIQEHIWYQVNSE